MKKSIILLLGLFILGLQSLAASFTFKFDGSGFISDGASVIQEKDKEKLDFYLNYVKAQTSYSILVVTLNDTNGISPSQIARVVSENGAGKDNKDNVLVFIIAPSEGKIGVELGDNLKSDISYVTLRDIIQEEISPAFKTGDYSSAITKGIFNISRVIEPSIAYVKPESTSQKLEPLSKPVINNPHPYRKFVFVAMALLVGLIVFANKTGKRKRSKRGGFGSNVAL